ncbi:MAG: 5'/3'-nucleotidase SurE [Clostridiales bacterium]|nr:5'/3'-nucleotidase SurE [Clostridiales bacterium]
MSRLILITNDDGITAPGIIKLARAATKLGEVYVVAPDGERSGQSHSFTYKSEVLAAECDIGISGVRAFACSGSPCDCVRIGTMSILPRTPDLVLSGINNGFNISSDIQYSATIGAVMESAFRGIHSIAFSRGSLDNDDLVDHYLPLILENLIDKKLSYNSAWNVNFPVCSLKECKGILRDCRISTDNFYQDEYTHTITDGKHVFKVIQNRDWSASEGTDLYAVTHDYISIGPVTNIS